MQWEKCRSEIATDGTVSKRCNVVRSSVSACITPAERQQLHSSRLHCSAWEKAERSEKDVQGKPTHTSGKSADLMEMRRQIRRQDFLNVFIAHVVSLGSKATLVKQWNCEIYLSIDELWIVCLESLTHDLLFTLVFNQSFSKRFLVQAVFALLVPKQCCEVPFREDQSCSMFYVPLLILPLLNHTVSWHLVIMTSTHNLTSDKKGNSIFCQCHLN